MTRPFHALGNILSSTLIFTFAFTLGCGDSSAPAPTPNIAAPAKTNDSASTTADAAAKPVDATSPTAELEKVQLQLNWFPEAEHGGFYTADINGYYRDAGLEVTILPGGPNAAMIQKVAGEQVEFAVASADQVLTGRAQDAAVVAVFAPLQMSPRCILVHESSGIKSLEELKGVTLAMSAGAAFAQYMQKKLPLTDVQVVPYPGNVTQFLLDKNYAQQGYVFSEPFVAKKEGGDPVSLMVSDLGFNPYTSILITNEKTIKEKPELVRKVVAAVTKGWQDYLEKPEATNALINKINPEMGLDVLEFGVEALKPLCITAEVDLSKMGAMTAERWNDLAAQLVEAEVIEPDSVKPEEAFTTEFLPN
ncbi:MAG: ABC transporter substrate-binding protein [Planctomycetaceae bacterium]